MYFNMSVGICGKQYTRLVTSSDFSIRQRERLETQATSLTSVCVCFCLEKFDSFLCLETGR